VLAVASGVVGQQPSDPYKEVPHYKFGQPRTAVTAIEAEIRAAKPDTLRAIEGKLLQILQSPEATRDAKAWVCRQLRQAGSERSVEALAPLLADKDLATEARFALQSIPAKKVDEALRAALGKLEGDLLAGVAQTVGVRGDRQAVPLLAPLASSKDPVVAEAALFALGHIGGSDALRAVQAAKVPASLKRYRWHALLLCAERIAAEGQAGEALAAYNTAYGESNDVIIKIAALRGIVLCDKAKAAVVATSALKSDQARLRAAAAKFLCELGGGETLGAVLADFSSMPVDTRVMVLSIVGDKAAVPAVLKAAQSGDPAVRVAALGALGRLGDASSVGLLLGVAGADKGEAQAAARKSLRELRAKEVDAALIAAAEQGRGGERIEAVQALAARGAVAAVPMLLKAAAGDDPQMQAESLGALAVLAEPDALPALVKVVVEAKTEPQRAAAEKAIVETCRRTENKDAAAGAVLAALPGPSLPVRCSLLRVLARIPCAKALGALRSAVNDREAAVSDAAIRGLAQWPNAAAAPDLLAIARSDKSATHKVLALRGVIRLAGPAGNLPAEQAVKTLADAMALAARAEEKKLALAALGEVKHAAAMDLALKCLSDQELEVEAATAVVKIAKHVRMTNADAAAAGLQKVLDVCKSPAARQMAEGVMVVLGGMVNIAPQGTATSPDDLEKDGGSGGDQAAIDGNPTTYWDEADGKKLYRFVVTFKQPEKIAAISIIGYEHHNYAPKDFEILCDGKVVKKVENAQYDNNFLVIRIDEVTCTSVELKITGYYGNSPAIRELGIYRPLKK